MALLTGGIYDALSAAGAPEDKARAAAKEVVTRSSDINDLKRGIALLKWMVGTGVVLQIGMLGTICTSAINHLSFH